MKTNYLFLVIILTAFLAISTLTSCFNSSDNSDKTRIAEEKLMKEGIIDSNSKSVSTNESQKINVDDIYGIWEQYKFTNKANNVTVDAPVTWQDGQNAVFIFKKNGNYSLGSINNNSVAGKFKIDNNVIIITFKEGDITKFRIITLTAHELDYSPFDNNDLIYYHKKK